MSETCTPRIRASPLIRVGPHSSAAALLAAALVVAAAGAARHHGLDTGLFIALNRWRGLPDAVWEMLSLAGLGVSALTVLALGAQRHPRVLAALAWCVVVSGGLTHLVKRLLVMPRPASVLDPGAFHVIGSKLFWRSMPSGHAVTAGAVVAILWIAGGRHWRRPWVFAGTVVLALSIGVSRIATGAHWPADVVAGAALGWGSAGISVDLARRSGLEGWLESQAGQAFLGVVQVGSGVAMVVLDSGFPQTAPLQWTLGALAIGMGVRSLAERSPMLARRQGSAEVGT